MVNPRKIYPVDPGLIYVFGRSGKANIGNALETAVRIELARRGMEVRYVRTRDGFEEDFLARSPDGETALIQVAAELENEATQIRKFRALQAASREHPRATLHLITMTPELVEPHLPDIQVPSAAIWFLQPWLNRPFFQEA